MTSIEEILGVESSNPEFQRSLVLAENDHQFLRDLVAMRRKLGLTQQDVADRQGVAQATVAAFERYDNDPKLSTIRRYAQVVGILIAHHVEADQGQLQLKNGEGWAGGWKPIGYSTVSPSIAPPVPATTQVSLPSDAIGWADIVLAA